MHMRRCVSVSIIMCHPSCLSYIPTGKVRKPTVGGVCSWVIKAWNGVKPKVIIKSFKKCGISNAMDGTEDDAVFELNDSSDDDDEKLAGIAKELTLVDISDESDEEFNDFYDV